MDLEPEVIQAAAELLAQGAGELPTEDEAEFRNLDERQTTILGDLMQELLPFDLHAAIEAAGARLNEDDYAGDDEDEEVTA